MRYNVQLVWLEVEYYFIHMSADAGLIFDRIDFRAMLALKCLIVSGLLALNLSLTALHRK